MPISLLTWKGIWDFFEYGLLEFLKDEYAKDDSITIKVGLAIGYVLYALTMLCEPFIVRVLKFSSQKELKRINFQSYLMNLYYLCCLITLVCIWRGFYSTFDYVILKQEQKKIIIVCINLSIFIFMYTIGLCSALFGPAGCDPADILLDYDDNNSDESSFSRRLFQINYF